MIEGKDNYDEEYPDLGYGSSNDENDDTNFDRKSLNSNLSDKKLMNQLITSTSNKDDTICKFTSSPLVVHFGGFRINDTYEQQLSIINASSASQRFQFLLPTTEYFKITFEKLGLLAPGMSVKVTVKFTPKEYIYYYDCMRVRLEGSPNLIVPFHAYPTANQVNGFPKFLMFGNSPLCEPAVKTITLSCSIPVSFSYKIEVLRPHPFFTVTPVVGVIPPSGSADVTITFNPITLGTCSTTVRLHIAQHGFVPIECVISARAVSGLLESKELVKAEQRVRKYIEYSGDVIHNTTGNNNANTLDIASPASPLSATYTAIKPARSLRGTNSTSNAITKRHAPSVPSRSISRSNVISGERVSSDPVTTLLTSTFKAPDLTGALSVVVQESNSLSASHPILSHEPIESYYQSNYLLNNKNIPAKPSGPGAGNAFDAGAHWITSQHRKSYLKNKRSTTTGSKTATLLPDAIQEKIIEGIKIPPQLNSTTAVSFVLTQEAGKLKPRDLKAAVDKERLARQQRAEDQEQLRAAGGGSSDCGALDLNAVLAEERINSDSTGMGGSGGDPYKRQLRELAFLSDVEQVGKLEGEKAFRVSEEFIGSDPMNEEEVSVVLQERRATAAMKRLAEWRLLLERNSTVKYSTIHPTVKAGLTSTMAIALGLQQELINEKATDIKKDSDDRLAVSHSKSVRIDLSSDEDSKRPYNFPVPTFDPNVNDVWSKRLNTLRKFIAVVSRSILIKRMSHRVAAIRKKLAEAGVTSREQAKSFVEFETAQANKKAVAVSGHSKSKSVSAKTVQYSGDVDTVTTSANPGATAAATTTSPPSAAMLVCSLPSTALALREAHEQSLSNRKYEVHSDMLRRVLFPRYVADDSTSRLQVTFAGMDDEVAPFDDRTFLPLKVCPEYVTLGYQKHKLPPAPLYFPPCTNKPLRTGAVEELYLRPPVTVEIALSSTPTVPHAISAQASSLLSPPKESVNGAARKDSAVSLSTPQKNQLLPSFMMTEEQATDDSSVSMVPPWMTVTHPWKQSDRDFFTPRPEMRLYNQGRGGKSGETEIESDWCVRPTAMHSLRYEEGNSFRERLLHNPGFLSANKYLLASQETLCPADPPPLSGPNLLDFFLPDIDRHRSGLCCFATDHERTLLGHDPDIPPMQQKLEREDMLTDSESDNEEDEETSTTTPSFEYVRQILAKPVVEETVPVKVTKAAASESKKKGGATPAAVAAAAVPAPVESTVSTPADNGDTMTSALQEADKRTDQVELLRDRKILDLEAMMLRNRKTNAEQFSQRLAELSKSSKCLLQALPVQLPFHNYEDEVYKLVEPQMPKLLSNFVENK